MRTNRSRGFRTSRDDFASAGRGGPPRSHSAADVLDSQGPAFSASGDRKRASRRSSPARSLSRGFRWARRGRTRHALRRRLQESASLALGQSNHRRSQGFTLTADVGSASNSRPRRRKCLEVATACRFSRNCTCGSFDSELTIAHRPVSRPDLAKSCQRPPMSYCVPGGGLIAEQFPWIVSPEKAALTKGIEFISDGVTAPP
jgi:hypothetical protein